MNEILSQNGTSQKFMTVMGQLMRQALDSPEGLRSLAAAIAKPIEEIIKTKEISSLLLTEHVLPKGERPVYQKRDEVRAHWISKDGAAHMQEIGEKEVEFPTHRISSTPMVDIAVLRHGNVGTLMDLQNEAGETIRKKIDKRTIDVISSAVPAENIVEVAGNTLTQEALVEAMSIIEDKEVAIKYIVMRGRRFADLKGWDMDPLTRNELRQKGVIKNFGTGSVLTTSAAKPQEVLIVPDVEIGKLPIREKLMVDPLEFKTEFRVGWLVWKELGHGITRPDLIAKVRLTG